MRNISLKTKILTGILTGGIYLSSVSTTFAITTNLTPLPTHFIESTLLTSECKQINITKKNTTATIDKPIATNTITQDQATKIKSVLNKSLTNKFINKKESNIDYAKTISNQKNKLYISNTNFNYINPLTALVDNGTITQSQSDMILLKQLYLYHNKQIKGSV